MDNVTSRRSVLKGSLAAAGLGLLGIPEWAMPVLAQGETLVPFTDIPANFATNPSEVVRVLDIRTIAGALTPKDQFFTTQHYGHPTIDPATFRLKISGLVERPKSFSLDELKAMGKDELVAGFECSGNGRGRVQGFASNGRWTGVPLRKVLKEAGLKNDGHEVVFFGADHGEEEAEFRQQKIKLDQAFGRSMPRETALGPDPLVAYAMNGEPLTKHQGAPLRLIVPGWYGVANVKWLAHPRAARHMGKFQSRWYRTMHEEDRRRDGVERDRRHAHAPEVDRRARVEGRRRASGDRLRAQRRHARAVGRGQGRRRPVAARDRRFIERQVLVEAVHLHVERRHARRAHHRLARDRQRRLRPARAGGSGQQEDVPRRQQPVSAEGDDRLSRSRGRPVAATRSVMKPPLATSIVCRADSTTRRGGRG